MKRIPLVVLIILAFVPGLAFAQQQRLAVLDTVLPDGIDRKVVIPVTEKIMEEFVKSKLFTVVDRSFIEKTLKEQEFQISDLVANDQKLTELGGFLKATYIVVSTVQKLDTRFFLSVKMIEVKTGVIIAQASADADGSSSILISLAGEAGQKLVMYANGQGPDAANTFTSSSGTTSSGSQDDEVTVAPPKPKAKSGFGKLGVEGGVAATGMILSEPYMDLFSRWSPDDYDPELASGTEFGVYVSAPVGKILYLSLLLTSSSVSYETYLNTILDYVTTSASTTGFYLGGGLRIPLGPLQPYVGLIGGYVTSSIELSDASSIFEESGPVGGFEAGLDLKIGKSLFVGGRYHFEIGVIGNDFGDSIEYNAGYLTGMVGLAF